MEQKQSQAQVASGGNPSGGNPSVGNLVTMTQEQFTQLLGTLSVGAANTASTTSKGLTTLFESSRLPKFKGRRRPTDLPFTESQSFTSYLSQVNAHIETLHNPSDKDKMSLLTLCSDHTQGDYYPTLCRLQDDRYAHLTYEEVIVHLTNIYATVQEKNIYDAASELKRISSVSIKNKAQTNGIINSFTETLNKYVDFMNKDTPYFAAEVYKIIFPNLAGQNLDTISNGIDLEIKKNLDNLLTEILYDTSFKLLLGNKLTNNIQKKLFTEKSSKSYSNLTKKLAQLVKECPNDCKVWNDEIIAPAKGITTTSDHVDDYSTFVSGSSGQPSGNSSDLQGQAVHHEGYHITTRGRWRGSRRVNSRLSNSRPRYNKKLDFYESGYAPDYLSESYAMDSYNGSCYNCGSNNHFIAQCPEPRRYNEYHNNRRYNRGNFGNRGNRGQSKRGEKNKTDKSHKAKNEGSFLAQTNAE